MTDTENTSSQYEKADQSVVSAVLPCPVDGRSFEFVDAVSQSQIGISVVIPVFNEIRTIGTVLERVLNTDFDMEIIVVDDGSTDGTREFLQQYCHARVKTIYHKKHAGKGAALRSGFASASKPYVLVQDADLEYNPQDFATMLPALVDGRADMVYGSRFLGGPHRVFFLALRRK